MSTRLTILLVVLLASLCGASSAGALTIGIADQKPDMFTDPRFLDSDLHFARRAVPWDALSSPTQTAELDTWLAAAHNAQVNPLLSFTHSSSDRRALPSPERMRARTAASSRLPSACSTSSAASGRGTRG